MYTRTMGKTWFTFQDELSVTIDCLVLYKKSNEKLITKKLKLLDLLYPAVQAAAGGY